VARMTPPEGCHRYREQIGALVLGKLDGGELEALRAHLDGCPYCQAEVRELEPVVAALADADPDRIAGDLEEIHRARNRGRWYGWSGLAAAAAFVVMGLVGLTWLLDQNEPIGSSGPSVPSGLSAEDSAQDDAQKEPKAAGPESGTLPKESSPERDVKVSSPGGEKPGAAPEKSAPGGGPNEPPASAPPASEPLLLRLRPLPSRPLKSNTKFNPERPICGGSFSCAIQLPEP
jgi:hypothetical protein